MAFSFEARNLDEVVQVVQELKQARANVVGVIGQVTMTEADRSVISELVAEAERLAQDLQTVIDNGGMTEDHLEVQGLVRELEVYVEEARAIWSKYAR